jgi:riboflavin synthase
VTAIAPEQLTFDVIAETLRRTTLGNLTAGSAVNYERSAKMGDEIGGHRVSGHVHTTAELVQLRRTDEEVKLDLKVADTDWMKYVLAKGFVAVDGCSLTVGEVLYPAHKGHQPSSVPVPLIAPLGIRGSPISTMQGNAQQCTA